MKFVVDCGVPLLMMCFPVKLLMLLPVLLVMVSCQPSVDVSQAVRPERVLYDWYDPGGPGKVSVEISLDRQIARYRRGDRLIGWSYVATGQGRYRTAEGNYKILEKKVEKVSSLYGRIVNAEGQTVVADARSDEPVPPDCRFVAAPMPYWMRITWSGVGMHGGPIPNPGYPASHGCIRLPRKFVPNVFEVVNVGTPVTIRRDFPDAMWMVPGPGLAAAD